MWYSPTVTVAAGSEPVTLVQLKAQCRIDGTDEDTLLTGYIASARAYVEAWTGTPLVSRTVTIKCDGFADFAALPVVPVASVSGVSYADAAGATQTLSTDVYEARTDGLTASLALKYGQTWPSIRDDSRITVTAVVGYSTVPEAVTHAILLLVSHWNENREATGASMQELPHAVEALLTNYRSFT